MRKQLFIAVLCAASTAAFATNNGSDGNSPSVGNVTATNGPINNTANGGAGGQGGAGYGGNASALAGAAAINKNDIKNSNQQSQGQKQGQSQGQGQSQSVKNSGNSSSASGVKNSGNSASLSSSNSGGNTQSNDGNNASTSVSVGGDTYEAARIPVATAYAPSIAPTAPCMGSTSGGAQVAGFGFSAGGTWTDSNCQLLEQVRAVSSYLGDKETAAEMMNDVPAYAEAKKRIADRKAGKAAVSTAAPSADVRPMASNESYSDPIIRSRLGLPPLSK